MRRRVLLVPLLAASMVVGASGSAAASPAQTPAAVPGTPSCDGLIVAFFNHDTINRQGNPNSSQGPGPFFGSDTHEAIETLARSGCRIG
jgi:hypothetical protein